MRVWYTGPMNVSEQADIVKNELDARFPGWRERARTWSQSAEEMALYNELRALRWLAGREDEEL